MTNPSVIVGKNTDKQLIELLSEIELLKNQNRQLKFRVKVITKFFRSTIEYLDKIEVPRIEGQQRSNALLLKILKDLDINHATDASKFFSFIFVELVVRCFFNLVAKRLNKVHMHFIPLMHVTFIFKIKE